MGRVTVYGARTFQRILFGQSANPVPAYYLALISMEEPTVFAVGDELDEPDVEDSGYERAEIANVSSLWVENTSNSITNSEDIVFSPALTDWGQIRYWALTNTPLDGDVFFVGRLITPLDVQAEDSVIIPTGAIDISFDVNYQGL